MKIVKLSIKRPSLVIVLFSILLLGGFLGYKSMGYELIPEFDVNVITVSTIYPGASPEEVESSVTKEIEDAVSTVENIKKIESKSYEGLSVVMVTLNSGANVDEGLDQAQRKINAMISDLPEDAKRPSLLKFSLNDLPIITAGATSSKLSGREFYDLLDKKIEPALAQVQGVAQINLIGGQEREIQVNLKRDKLVAYGISIAQVQKAILSANLDFPTGQLKTRKNNITIRLSGKFQSIEELANLVVRSRDGTQIRLEDIAVIKDAEKDVEKIARVSRDPAILIEVIKQSEANAVEVSESIRKQIKTTEKNYAEKDVELTVVNDTSTFTLEAANGVIHDLLIAIALVAVVMLLFLHSIRNAFIVMISIPSSIIASFIGMALLGYTLNLMSLLGLSLVVGILVDDAIVVLENIYRHMEMGKGRIRAAYDGASEIGFTVSAITLTIVVVFLPIALSTGLVANIIAQFCVTVVIATLLSLLSSFTIVPWLSSRFGKLQKLTGKNFFERFILGFENLLTRFTEWITEILKWCLRNRKTKLTTLGVVLLILVLSAGLTKFIGSSFMPQIDKGEFLVQIELPKNASIEQTNQVTQKAEAFLAKKSEIKKLITTVGQQSSGFGMGQSTAYQSEINVILVGKDKRQANTYIYAAKVGNQLSKKLTGAKVQTIPVGLMGAQQAPLALIITGSETDSVRSFAKKALAQLKTIKGATEAHLSSESGRPEISVEINRDKMSMFGLTIAQVGRTMQTAFSGNTDAKYSAGQYEYDINIRLSQSGRSDIQDVKDIVFINKKGQKIKLSQFARVTHSTGPSFLERYNQSRSITVMAQTVGVPIGTVAENWEAKFSKLDKPEGVEYVWGGDISRQQQGFGTLGIALAAAVILVYFVMVALYDSFIDPLVVMFSVPLAVIGVFVILALTNNSLNTFTILGMIMLIGLVTKNAILLVDFINLRKAEGESTFDALIQANHARLRPILMTTIAMVFGMLPIALATGKAAEMNNGLAWVIIGGLISSLFLTLIFVPVVYSIFESIINRFSKNKEEIDYEKAMHADYEPK